ncbi:putative F-box protein PP2-B12 [Lycium ferocissimum]|uniref:putative F-box protein PP2-B12 n=1 Tax=Lycium ferocissimum TaxID=112874 RepID=UPI002814BDFE|nr:putative F-box protein PP2-B12 [Lycium ferocissimum]
MEKEKGEEDKRSCSSSTCLWMLPEGCIAEILSLTSPRDVCRLSLVSPSLQSAADSDSVWEKFLPSDYQSIIAGSPTPIPDFRSLKDLYVYLSHHPILIDEGRKSFSLEKSTGKKCYFLGARYLTIAWGDTPEYWEWTSLPESRFLEVAQLKIVWWLEIWGTIRAGILSPMTSYAANLVYKFEDDYGFDTRQMEVSVGISGVQSENVRVAYLHPDPQFLPEFVYDELSFTPGSYNFFTQMESNWHWPEDSDSSDTPLPKLRDDGWFELELGEFFTGNEDDFIELRMQDVMTGCRKKGLIVEGIEIRPRIA